MRLVLAGGWLLATLLIATYALLKPSTSAADLGFVPDVWVRWLDANYDLRTLVMTLAITLPPAALLVGPMWRWHRSLGLGMAGGLLLACEFAQIGINSRGFGWPDVGYTVLGVLLSEALIRFAEWMQRS